VLDCAAGVVVIERGDLSAFGDAHRVAVLAHYSTNPQVSLSFRTLVRELDAADYQVVVVSASEFDRTLEWNGDLPPTTVVLRQPNIGYDFGSWAIGLDQLGVVAGAPYVILANDSVVGPFTSLRPLLDDFEATAADVWALTDTYQNFHHLQSYFLGFRRGILLDRPLKEFFADIRLEPTKWDVIRRNELGLSWLLHREGYTTVSAFRSDTVVVPGENPVIRGWSELLARGYPFVKREIVRDPSVAPRAEFVSLEVAAAYGQSLEEWL
jgi:lipopolysaccharide biosynthesis protein